MNGFIGLEVYCPISSHKAFDRAIRQVLHYLHLQPSLKFNETDYLITIGALHNTNTFSLSKHPSFVHSGYHLVSFSEVPTQAEVQYFGVIYECLLILKEYFPAKVEVQITTESEQLQDMLRGVVQGGATDLKRRYLSHFRSMLLHPESLTRDEFGDVLQIIRRQDSPKLLSLGLSILKKAPIDFFEEMSQMQSQTLAKIGECSDYSKAIQQIQVRIDQARRDKGRLQESRRSTTTNLTKYDQPSIINSYVFQLRESNSLERISFLLDKLTSQMDKLDKGSSVKIHRTIFDTLARLSQNGKIEDNQQTSIFLRALLKYLMITGQVTSWHMLLQLISQCSEFPKVVDEVLPTLEVFYQQYKQRCDPTVQKQLSSSMDIWKTRAKSQTLKQMKTDDSCKTSRNAAKSKRSTRSVIQ